MLFFTVSANGGWWLEITFISLQRVSAMSICHFGPISAFRFMHVQIRPVRAFSVSGLPGIYLASPQVDYMEERVLFFKTGKLIG